MTVDNPIQVQITRTVRPGSERAFEAELRAFIPISLEFPGHLGVQVIVPQEDRPRLWHILIRFTSPDALERFRAWEPYRAFIDRIRPLLDNDPVVREQCGLEQWVSLPGDSLIRRVPRWKLAVATLLGVYPTSLVLGIILHDVLPRTHRLLGTLAMSAAMVLLLTYVVMPVVTRVLHPWLHHSRSKV